MTAKGISVRTVLRKVLGDFNLAYIIKDQAIQVTSPLKARESMVVRAYPVADIVNGGALRRHPGLHFGPAVQQAQVLQNAAQLIDMIQSTVEPAELAGQRRQRHDHFYAPHHVAGGQAECRGPLDAGRLVALKSCCYCISSISSIARVQKRRPIPLRQGAAPLTPTPSPRSTGVRGLRDDAMPQAAKGMILEGIVTTVAPRGRVNIAPMGPHVDAGMERFLLRPFRTAQTYRNLKAHGEGVLHVTDDVLLLARAALGPVEPPPPLLPAARVRGLVLRDACRYYEFRVRSLDDREERSRHRGGGGPRRPAARLLRLQPGQARRRRGGHPGHAHRLPAAGRDRGRVPQAGRPRGQDRRRAGAAGVPLPAANTSTRVAQQAARGRTAAMIRVQAPSRLHFGLLSLPAGPCWPNRHGQQVVPARRFGGVGLMVQAPGLRLTVAAGGGLVGGRAAGGAGPGVRPALCPELAGRPVPQHADRRAGRSGTCRPGHRARSWGWRWPGRWRRRGLPELDAVELAGRVGRGRAPPWASTASPGAASWSRRARRAEADSAAGGPRGVSRGLARWSWSCPAGRQGLHGPGETEAFQRLRGAGAASGPDR